MLADIRREINEPASEGFLTDHENIAYLNRAQDQVFKRIEEADQNFFEDTDQSLGFVADQEEYELPARLWNRKITRVVQTDVNLPDGRELKYLPFQKAKSYVLAGSLLWQNGNPEASAYYIRDQKIGIKPTPKRTVAGNILLHFIRLIHEMHWAQVGSPAASSFTMPVSTVATPPYLKAGRISTTAGYYVGARIRILTGPDRGLERRITAYSAATRVATIDTAWTPANVSNEDYVILSPIPEEYHNLLYQLAMLKCAKKAKDTVAYQAAKAEAGELWQQLETTIVPRHQDGSRHVLPPEDDWE